MGWGNFREMREWFYEMREVTGSRNDKGIVNGNLIIVLGILGA